ncbi:RNA polymerase factor sigma-54 [Borreliella spielmanii]|uniref:RNA polymerase sigma-54 factor n=1 Tax=Borreliella spielmanii A14S TaxID=498742 RepID=B9X8Q3_9SPIR|nr:RNA polymerase factor sigma-54 [Borreliella spielmanii]EEF84314.1 RNA polymerase sigma-54 factor [Borreliella spielmanii A14S]WKC83526.1 RNA polymerase factor sigma-54 [Borreliella spielmanii]
MIKQKLKLSQNLNSIQIQTIKILGLNKKELAQLILEESENNECLKIVPNKIFFETLKTYRFKKFFYKEDNMIKNQHDIALEKTHTNTSLKEHLLLQLRIQRINEDELKIGEILINNLNNKGFHIINPYDLFKKEEKEKVKKIIELIQKFDPIGICVPNIIESLILQAKHHKLESNIIKILEKAELLEKTQEKLKEELKIRSKEFNTALEIIRQKLNPNPTIEFKDPEDTNFYVDPDILIINRNNKFEIKIKEVSIFKKELKRTPENPQKQKKAKWLIESLRYRDEILAKIGIAIYTLQKEFLRRGFKSLRPMNLRILSEKINVSKSTISRAIKNKYLKCEWGTILIKELFSSVGGAKTNEFSKLSIKITVKKLLEVNKKMSDKAISAILKSKGISISRRTVNKYRNELKSEKGKIYYGT